MEPISENKNSILAILPFQVVSSDERIKNLFFGFTEDLITNFSKFIGLSVISSYSTLQIKDISNQALIDKLGANYIIYGSVRPIKDHLRISIQLVNTSNKSLVFGAQHDVSIDELDQVQDDVIQQIVSVIQEKIDYNLLSHSYKKNAVELAAYENYLIGMNVLKMGSADSDEKARVYFNAALQVDPNYSLAYTGLALSYFNFWSCLLWDRWDESMKGAHKFALKAIEIEPNDYTALGILGRTYVYKGDYDQAEHCLRKSLRMNPNDASNLLRTSFSLMLLGYANEAVSLYLRAVEINPFHKEVYFAYGSNYYLQAGDFEQSIALSKKVQFNCWTDFPAWVAAAYLQVNDYDKVWECWSIFLTQFEQMVYTGDKDLETEALEWLDILNPFKGSNYLTPLYAYIASNSGSISPTDKKTKKTKSSSFQLHGDIWKLGYSNQLVSLKSAKGFFDIQKLLQHPGEEFHSMDLMGSGIEENSSTSAMDHIAKEQYIHRVKELRSEIDEAEKMNQIERSSVLREEYDKILDHLSESMGLDGKTRKIGTTAEKARSAVTWRIRNTIKKIEKVHPELGKHLATSIKTGTFCSYRPELEITWII